MSAHGLGYVFRPRAVFRYDGSETEPDLMVRAEPAPGAEWEELPLPGLVVEVLSGTRRQRDRIQKRSFYMDAGIPEYWILDPKNASLTVVRPGVADEVTTGRYEWRPAGAGEGLSVTVGALFPAAS